MLLAVQNFLSTKSRLISRYGLRNVLQRKLAGMLGLRQIETQAQARIDHITRKNLR
jgi:hypothetical protein